MSAGTRNGRPALVVLAVPVAPVVVAPVFPGYADHPITRYVITMAAVPAAAAVFVLVAVTALERLVIRPITRRGGVTD